MRPRLRAERSAPDAHCGGAVQFVRLRRHQRHARPVAALSSVRLELRPSPWLAVVIVAAHGAAAVCAALAVPGPAGWALGGALFALGLATAWSRALLRAPGSVRALEIDAPALVLHLTDGGSLRAEPSPRRYVSRWFVTLSLLPPVRRTLLVPADMLAPAEFRRLRLWALWGKLPVAAKHPPA
ncbi:MAG: protein YgfX [Betaproteobacteria bacterium]